jgi:glycosyltransferase involved in cell wall biosynthesis
MPAYNAASYLKEAIDSILYQSFSDFEFIIINDGSSDHTEKIILAYTDPRIVYIKNETNIGLIASLNKGIQTAKGKYFARMDADDIAIMQRLERQVGLLESDKEIVVTGSDYYQLKNKQLHLVQNQNDSDYQKAMLIFAPCFCHPAVMMRNVFSELNLAYNPLYKHAEDYKLWTDFAKFGRFANVNEPLLKYRSHAQQISAEHNAEQLAVSKRIRSEYLNSLGLIFTPEEMEIIDVIGNNQFIRSSDILLRINHVLIKLRDLNADLKLFNNKSLYKLIHKVWMDSCGYSSLGLTAYNIYKSSELSNITWTSPTQRLKLLGKCFIRKFK